MAQTSVEVFLGMNAKKFLKGTKQAQTGAKKFLAQLKEQEQRINSIAKKSAIAFAAVAAAITATIIPAKRLQDEITNALTLVTTQGDEFEEMSEGMEKLARKLSKELGVSADKVGAGFYQVLSAGAEVLSDDFEELTRTALQMGKLVGLETAQSVEILADTINAFGFELKDATKVADAFFTASKLSATTVPQLAEAMREAANVAGPLGITLGETTAILAAFAAKGIKGGKAGTTFRVVVSRMAAATGEAKVALEALGVKAFDPVTGKMRSMIDILDDLKKGLRKLSPEQQALNLKLIAGEEAFAKISALLEFDTEKLREWSAQVEAGGNLQTEFNKKMSTLSGQLDFLKVELEDVAITLGKQFLPGVIEAARNTAAFISRIGEWVERNKKLAASLLGGAGFGLGAIVAVTQLMRLLIAMPAIILAMQGPLGIVILGLLALAGAFAFVMTSARQFPITLKEQVKRLREVKTRIAEVEAELVSANRVFGESEAQTDAYTKKLASLRDEQSALDKVIKGGIKQRKLEREATRLSTEAVEEEKGAIDDSVETFDLFFTKLKARVEMRERENRAKKEALASGEIEPIFSPEVLEQIHSINRTLDEYRVKIREMPLEQSEAAEQLLESIEGLAVGWANAFVHTFETISQAESNFAKAFGNAFFAALKATFSAFIQVEVAKLLAKRAATLGLITLESFLNPFNLLKLGPAAAAGAAAIAAVQAIKLPEFSHGGVSPGGLTLTHPKEVIFNPKHNTMSDFLGFVQQAGGFQKGDVGMGVQFYNYGSITTEAGLDELMRRLGDTVRQARVGREGGS